MTSLFIKCITWTFFSIRESDFCEESIPPEEYMPMNRPLGAINFLKYHLCAVILKQSMGSRNRVVVPARQPIPNLWLPFDHTCTGPAQVGAGRTGRDPAVPVRDLVGRCGLAGCAARSPGTTASAGTRCTAFRSNLKCQVDKFSANSQTFVRTKAVQRTVITACRSDMPYSSPANMGRNNYLAPLHFH